MFGRKRLSDDHDLWEAFADRVVANVRAAIREESSRDKTGMAGQLIFEGGVVRDSATGRSIDSQVAQQATPTGSKLEDRIERLRESIVFSRNHNQEQVDELKASVVKRFKALDDFLGTEHVRTTRTMLDGLAESPALTTEGLRKIKLQEEG